MHGRQSGLTLVELMVTVAVLAILATVAYPLYTTQAQKARRADAKMALETIAMAEERFYTVNGSYTDDLAQLQMPTALQGGNSEKGYYGLAVEHPGGDVLAFTVTATAQDAQADDGKCATFTIDHVGAKDATGDDPAKCW